MTTIRIIGAIFTLACFIMGAIWAHYLVDDNLSRQVYFMSVGLGGVVGCIVAGAVFLVLRFVTQELFERLAPAFVLIVLAIMMGSGIANYIQNFWQPEDKDVTLFLSTSLVLIFGFIGIFLGLTRASMWESMVSAVRKHTTGEPNPKLVDTSVIIDGRITDICRTGFIEGTLIVPRFVLKELQNIADSSDVLRRAKGRRGLDIVNALQEPDSGAKVKVIDDDPLQVPEVDGKLVALAREMNAKILTNDFNLNKVARIEGVDVLNINDLANALKPAVLPDENMEVKIIKEGKEPMQGVGYLDDGTMVVVDGGKHYLGDTVRVIVTSVLQTAAGRMIFGKINGIAAS